MTLVADFHRAFGTIDPSVPTPPDRALAALRLRLIEEEFKEVQTELRQLMLHDSLGSSVAHRLETMAKLLKELCDLQYVVQGTADSLGFGAVFDAAYHEVHRSNMSKMGADGRPIRRESDGKVLKGPLYYPPDMEQFVHVTENAASADPACADCPSGSCLYASDGTCHLDEGMGYA